MKLDQTVTKVVSQSASVDAAGSQVLTPTTLKRTAKTTVVVKSGETVVIGGMIQDDSESGTYKVPLLGDIPLLGWLFKSRSTSNKRTNLFVFITPRIIEQPEDARKIKEEKMDYMKTIQEGTIRTAPQKKAGGQGERGQGERMTAPLGFSTAEERTDLPAAAPDGAGMVDLLLQKKALTETELLAALSEEYGIPFWEELPTDHIDTGFTALFSIQYLKKQKMVPLDTPQGRVVAVNDPANFQAADDLCRLLGLPERPVVLRRRRRSRPPSTSPTT